MTQHINTCTHITCDASAQPKPWSRLDSDTFHSFHSTLMLGYRFRCIIFMLRPLGYRCGTQNACVKETVRTWFQRINHSGSMPLSSSQPIP